MGARRENLLPTVSDWQMAVFLISLLESHWIVRRKPREAEEVCNFLLPVPSQQAWELGWKTPTSHSEKHLWESGQCYLSLTPLYGCPRNAPGPVGGTLCQDPHQGPLCSYRLLGSCFVPGTCSSSPCGARAGRNLLRPPVWMVLIQVLWGCCLQTYVYMF